MQMEQQSMRKALYKKLSPNLTAGAVRLRAVQFSGADNTFYERRLIFDKLISLLPRACGSV